MQREMVKRVAHLEVQHMLVNHIFYPHPYSCPKGGRRGARIKEHEIQVEDVQDDSVEGEGVQVAGEGIQIED